MSVMKKNITRTYSFLLLVLLLPASFFSCSDWLDVKPKAQIEAEVLLETENGFKDALTGVYLNMCNTSIYGKEMNFGYMDVLAQQYDMDNVNEYYQAMNYEYDDERTSEQFAYMWEKLYNTIANINNILGQIDERSSVLNPLVHDIIKGECLGLRAFIHFDILRIWGYGNLAAESSNLEKLTIPYVTRFEKHISPQLKEKEVLEHIHKDLSEAAKLLQSADPVSYYPKDGNNKLPNEDGYFTDRQIHFNYCAVCATKARVLLWEGRYKEAFAVASEVAERSSSDFPWVKKLVGNDRTKFDLLFSVEHMFSLDITNLYDNFKLNLELQYSTGNNPNAFYQTVAYRNEIFEVPNCASDYRLVYHYDLNNGGRQHLDKFFQGDNYTYRDRMPLVRKSELYYIMAESLNNSGSEADRLRAIGYLNEVRVARNLFELKDDLTQQEVAEEITKEYRKEFISEGQLFFYYKRLGMKRIPRVSKVMDNSIYVLPLPDIELEFGGRVDTNAK